MAFNRFVLTPMSKDPNNYRIKCLYNVIYPHGTFVSDSQGNRQLVHVDDELGRTFYLINMEEKK